MPGIVIVLSSLRHVSSRLLRLTVISVLLLCAFTGTYGRAQQGKPDLVLNGTVTYADRQTYLELPFAVGKDVTRLSVELSYTQHDKHTNIDLGVFDTGRFRGWSGGNKSFFTISETDATPSYLPGVIVPGKWKLILGVPNIEEGVRSDYEAKIYFSHRKDPLKGSTFSQKPLREGAAWYRGDLHMHNAHSDGSCKSQSGEKVPCPLYKTVEDAANRKLDFIAITDHNTMSQYNDMRELQPYFDKLLLMPGREVTTFQGHANVFGTTAFIDFRLTSPHVPTVNKLLEQVQDLHSLISLNHPGSPSGAACMGCGWTAPDTDFSRVNAIEAINGGSLDGPRSGIPFWQDKLNKGFRLTAIGGSDNHDADYGPSIRSAVGHPTTVVYAPNLTEEAILNGIRAGHVFIDIEGTPDRTLEFSANADGTTASMGDSLASPKDQHVRFTITMRGLENAHPEIIRDGDLAALANTSPLPTTEETRSFDYVSDGKRHWLRVNIRSADGSLLVLGNPIYLNF